MGSVTAPELCSTDESELSDSYTEAMRESPTLTISGSREIVPSVFLTGQSTENAPDAIGEYEDTKSEESAQNIMAARAYQLEMFQRSLEQNVIVAMDTGSGKTQVAVLRIKAELDRCSREKIIWFLAPTVALCEQQFETIRLQMASASMRLLTGNEKMKNWNVSVWEAILDGVRIVVSTYQVLLEALSHAFVKISDLALIVFDEVHNCVQKHPGSKIMLDFYNKPTNHNETRPAILGLTATPSMNSSLANISQLERLLHARCISPTLHREELLKCVKRPYLSRLIFTPCAPQLTSAMQSLKVNYENLSLETDPYILHLKSNLTDRNRRALDKAISKDETYSILQVRGLLRRAMDTQQRLGSWAADYYLWATSSQFLDRIESAKNDIWDSTTEDEKYLANILRSIRIDKPPDKPAGASSVTDKVKLLLRELLSAEEPVVGIVFVKERATATVLSSLLSTLAQMRAKYRVGKMVGTSNFGKRRSLFELGEGNDMRTLQDFRSGKINLLIGTAVLEEGIDVPACNLVICFDKPDTYKSFIQRRGRARMRDSRLVLLNEEGDIKVDQWSDFEREMDELYADTLREREAILALEESEDSGSSYFEVASTGARLDFDNAKQHLGHFCDVLSQGEFVDSRPDYIIEVHGDNTHPELKAEVILPSFAPQELRQAKSKFLWRSEKNATKDAAFQAYLALYKAGLINEHLLPHRAETFFKIESRAAEVEVVSVFQPWRDVAYLWKHSDERWLYTVECCQDSTVTNSYDLILPLHIQQPQPIRIYLGPQNECEVRLAAGRQLQDDEIQQFPDHTTALLGMHFGQRWKIEQYSHVVRVTAKNVDISVADIGCRAFDPAEEAVRRGEYFIRDHYWSPHLYKSILPCKPPAQAVQHTFRDYSLAPTDEPYLVLTKWTRRADFLHPLLNDSSKEIKSAKQYQRVLPLSWATVDNAKKHYAQFGMLIPSIIHELEVLLVAQELATSLLSTVALRDHALVREAISARGALEPVNYERLEFLGDSILKYCASVHVAAEHPDWPEGYLSFFKDGLVSNSRLSRAALETGLARFILTKCFTGQRWRPYYVEKILEEVPERADRKISSKVLADVVEALIGASYVSGGIKNALKCLSIFLSECDWKDDLADRNRLYEHVQSDEKLPPILEGLESLLQYSFNKKALIVEAVTHASYVSDINRRSLERLEFIGDAILDKIIVTRLFAHEPPLPHYRMHGIKTAMVNKDFLAFIVLEEYETKQVKTTLTEEFDVKQECETTAIWKFLRHTSPAVGLEQVAMTERYKRTRNVILDALRHGNTYPWVLLAHMQAKKFYSDLFEALLGAIWVDSGSLEACEAMVARFGILDYLNRMLRDEVHVKHPKEEIGILAVTEIVTYKLDVRHNSDDEKEYLCALYVGERLVVEADGGLSREEIKTKAAEQAVQILKAEKLSAEGRDAIMK